MHFETASPILLFVGGRECGAKGAAKPNPRHPGPGESAAPKGAAKPTRSGALEKPRKGRPSAMKYQITEAEAKREILESAHTPTLCAPSGVVLTEHAEAWAMGFVEIPGPLAYHDAHTMVWCRVV